MCERGSPVESTGGALAPPLPPPPQTVRDPRGRPFPGLASPAPAARTLVTDGPPPKDRGTGAAPRGSGTLFRCPLPRPQVRREPARRSPWSAGHGGVGPGAGGRGKRAGRAGAAAPPGWPGGAGRRRRARGGGAQRRAQKNFFSRKGFSEVGTGVMSGSSQAWASQ